MKRGLFALSFLMAQAYAFDYQGVVKDTLGKPVKGVLLELVNSDGKILYKTTSDKNGTFHIKTDLKIFALKAIKKGYKPTVKIVSSKSPIDISIAPKKIKLEYVYKRAVETPSLSKGILSQKITKGFYTKNYLLVLIKV